MASTQENYLTEDKFSTSECWFLIAIGTLLLALGVSGESLWVDEGYSAKLAMQPSLLLWARTLKSILGSEPQMPAYQLYLWGWSRVFGMSEWAMRLANLPWAALFTASLAWGSQRILKVRRVWLIVCLSPFLWFYMNEARPYAMMLGLSMLTTVAVLAYAKDSQRFGLAPWWAMVSLLGLWSAHMLALTLVPSLVVLLCVLRPASAKDFVRQWILPVLVTLPLYLALALYYWQTVASGKGGKIERPGLSNLGFALYEFLGFSGLGPPRTTLRLHPSLHTLLPYLSTLSLGVLALVLVGIVIVQQIRRSSERRTILALTISFAVGVLFTFALAYAVHLRLLGRHLAVFPPILAFLLLTGVQHRGDLRQRRLALGALLLLGMVWFGSDVKQRVFPDYRKDDYRDAAALARNALAHGESVLWLADRETARYYGLQSTQGLEKGALLPPHAMEAISGVCSPSRFQQSLDSSSEPVLVVITDREFFDPDGGCRKLLESGNNEHVASFSDFEAWRVSGNQPMPGPSYASRYGSTSPPTRVRYHDHKPS